MLVVLQCMEAAMGSIPLLRKILIFVSAISQDFFFQSGFRMKLFQRWILYCHVNVLQKFRYVHKKLFPKEVTSFVMSARTN